MLDFLDEEALQPVFAEVGLDRPRIAPLAGGGERPVVEVAGEDLDARARRLPFPFFEQQDGERIGFLAGGAADRPHANGVVGTAHLEQGRDHRLCELGERHGVAEERSHRNQQVGEQLLRFLRVLSEIPDVSGEAVLPGHLHPPADPPAHRRALVAGEVVPGAGAEKGDDPGDLLLGLFLGGRHQRPLAVQHFGDPLGQHRDGLDEIGHPGGDGAARHHRELGLLRVLHQDHAAGFLQSGRRRPPRRSRPRSGSRRCRRRAPRRPIRRTCRSARADRAARRNRATGCSRLRSPARGRGQ